MDKDTTDHVGRAIHWLAENWQLTVLLIGGMFWSAVWAVKKVFPTHKVMRDCEHEMGERLDRHEREEFRRADEFSRSNAEQHQEIRADLRQIRDYIMGSNGK